MVAEIFDFRKYKIIKDLELFRKHGTIPEYFTKKQYMQKFCSLTDAINEWKLIVKDETWTKELDSLKESFVAWATYTEKQNLTEYNQKITNGYTKIINNLATNDSQFRLVGLHNKNNKTENLVIVFAEQLQYILEEDQLNSRDQAIIEIIDAHKIEIFEALEKDILAFKTYLKAVAKYENSIKENKTIKQARDYLSNLDAAKLILRYAIMDYQKKKLVSAAL